MEAIFFPRNDYSSKIEVCAHRLGKKMTYTEQTDGVRTRNGFSCMQFLSLAKSRNIKGGAFFSYYDPTFGSLTEIKQNVTDGHLWVDEYSLAPSTYNKITNFISPTEQEFFDSYNTELLPVFMENFGKKPVALSYSYGQNGFKKNCVSFIFRC